MRIEDVYEQSAHELTLEDVLDNLNGVKKSSGGYIAFCPAHSDYNHRSLKVDIKPDGFVAFRCYAGCTQEAVAFAIKPELQTIPLEVLIRPDFIEEQARRKAEKAERDAELANQPKVTYKVIKTYDYLDLEGELQYQAVRLEPKTFRQRRPDGKGDWHWNLEGVNRILYRLPEIAALDPNDMVIICYSPDTEVLTKKGWQRFDSLERGIEIAQYDKDTEEVSFVVPSAYQVFDYDGEMVSVKSRWCDLLVTPDHRMLVKKQNKSQETILAKDLTHKTAIRVSGNISGKNYPITKLRFLAALEADGCWEERGNQVSFRSKKERKQKRLKEILTDLEIQWQEYDYKSIPGWIEFRFQKEDWMMEYLDFSSSKKAFSWKLLELGSSVLDFFIQELQYWDGDSGKVNGLRYFTSIKQSAEVVSAVSAVCGYGCTLLSKNRSIEKGKELSNEYILNIVKADWRYIAEKLTGENITKKVYCCTVESGLLIVRRNGKSFISHNCEGEKDVDTLWGQGFPATTNVGGAVNWLDSYNDQFYGRPVVIIEDNDKAGRLRTEKLTVSLMPFVSSIKVIKLDGEKEHYDITDFFDEGGTPDELCEMIEDAEFQVKNTTSGTVDETETEEVIEGIVEPEISEVEEDSEIEEREIIEADNAEEVEVEEVETSEPVIESAPPPTPSKEQLKAEKEDEMFADKMAKIEALISKTTPGEQPGLCKFCFNTGKSFAIDDSSNKNVGLTFEVVGETKQFIPCDACSTAPGQPKLF